MFQQQAEEQCDNGSWQDSVGITLNRIILQELCHGPRIVDMVSTNQVHITH